MKKKNNLLFEILLLYLFILFAETALDQWCWILSCVQMHTRPSFDAYAHYRCLKPNFFRS